MRLSFARSAPLLAAAFAFAAFAGCTGSHANAPLDTIYGTDLAGGNVTAGTTVAIQGIHLEGRIGTGNWSEAVNATVEAGTVQGPTMAAPSALGGGGETTALALPGNASTTLTVRFREAPQLAGYFARYFVGRDVVTARNQTGSEPLPGDAEFHTTLTSPGLVVVVAALYKTASDTTPVAWFTTGLTARLAYHWMATGDVEPQYPDQTGQGLPWPTAHDAMVDVYTLPLPAGVTVTATTVYDGDSSPSSGTDVDLGLYNPDGAGIVCSGSGAGTAPVDHAQASETVSGDTDGNGTWSVKVGDISGCGGTGNVYTNAGPVAYRLDIVVG